LYDAIRESLVQSPRRDLKNQPNPRSFAISFAAVLDVLGATTGFSTSYLLAFRRSTLGTWTTHGEYDPRLESRA